MPVKKAVPSEKSVRGKRERERSNEALKASNEEGMSMNEELSTVDSRLRDLTEHLEQRVSERTAELNAEIVERQKTQLALTASEQKFRSLFRDSPVGMCQADFHDARLLMVNPSYCAMTGYSEAELLGRPFVEITPAQEQASNLEEFLELGRGRRSGYQSEKCYIRKDGSPIWVDMKVIMERDVQGAPLHVLAIISDISERKLLQSKLTEHAAALQQERNFIDVILNTVAALIIVIDPEERLIQFNTACSTLTGYDFARFKGSSRWLKLVPPDEMPGIREVVDRLRSGEGAVQHENNWTCRDGSKRLIFWRNSVIRDEAGQVQYMIGTGVDVTEQRKAETRARDTLEEASRLQRMQTANELATVLAHELNQPLAAIASYAEAGQRILGHTPLERDKLIRNLEKISKQSLRAGDAIRHIRAFVGRGRIEPKPLDLNEVVRETCILMTPKSRSRGVEIVLDMDGTLPHISGVGVHIEQVLLNLMRNAIDAIRDARMKEGTITVSTRRENGMAQVSVCDTGPGIETGRVDKVFEPLSSNKSYGLGVGLRICRSLIEAHGGRLWVEPHVPGGIFHFVLPFAP